jgi:cytoskeletal protein RodZ
MKKSYLCLLTLAMMLALILFAGCTTSNQTSQQISTNTSTSSTTTSATSSTATSATVAVSPSPSPTVATPTPSVSGKIATSIQFAPSNPTVPKGTNLGIDVLVSGIRICSDGAVTVLGTGGQPIGTVSPGGSSGCYYTATLVTSSINPGTYDVTLKFAGDSTHQPSQSTSRFTIT